MAKLTPIAEQIAALNELRADPASESAAAALRKALGDRSNRVVARAAEIAGQSETEELIPPLLAAYARLLDNPQKADPGCVGKIAIAEALIRLEFHDLDFYRAGVRYTQYEPVWGGEDDTAPPVRSACAQGLVLCASILEALNCFAELLADPHHVARSGAARAIANLGHPEGVPLLKLKLLVGDKNAEVIGECCSAVLRLAPEDGLSLVTAHLDSDNLDIRVQAAIALGESRRPEAFAPLWACWKRQTDRSVRKIVLTAIGLLRSDEADAFLVSLIRGPNEQAAGDAIAALAPFVQSAGLQSSIEEAVRESGSPRLREALGEAVGEGG